MPESFALNASFGSATTGRLWLVSGRDEANVNDSLTSFGHWSDTTCLLAAMMLARRSTGVSQASVCRGVLLSSWRLVRVRRDRGSKGLFPLGSTGAVVDRWRFRSILVAMGTHLPVSSPWPLLAEYSLSLSGRNTEFCDSPGRCESVRWFRVVASSLRAARALGNRRGARCVHVGRFGLGR